RERPVVGPGLGDRSAARLRAGPVGHLGSRLAVAVGRCRATARRAGRDGARQTRQERTMRLSDFIVSNLEPILSEWETFARTHIPAGEAMDVAALRDHAADILKTVAADLQQWQSERERAEKSKGEAERPPGTADTAAQTHGALRAEA